MSTLPGFTLVASAVLVAYGLPLLGVAVLLPALSSGRLAVSNYRGVLVARALWVAYPVWALGLLTLRAGIHRASAGLSDADALAALVEEPVAIVPLYVVIGVALGAVLFGVIDDVWGSEEARGFRGHVGSLARGRITTGGLKLVGIGLVSLGAAVYTTLRVGLPASEGGGAGTFVTVATTLLGTLVIALSANAVNLADLRPGRALKAGFVLLAVALLSALGLCASRQLPWEGTLLAVVLVFVVLGGPMLAMWPYDVRERGMLGDGGANAVGASVGYAIFAGLAPAASAGALGPLVALGVIAGLLLVVNGLSERYSFSALIERSALLRRLDQLGRPVPNEDSSEGRVDVN